MTEQVHHPSHYADNKIAGLECIDIAVQIRDFCLGNVFKYVWRAGSKASNSSKQDLDKAAKYLEFYVLDGEFQLPEVSRISIYDTISDAESFGPFSVRERYVLSVAEAIAENNVAKISNLIDEMRNIQL